MGCGCNKNNVIQTSRTTLSQCPELYEVLRQLDLKVINLMNVENTKILQETIGIDGKQTKLNLRQ